MATKVNAILTCPKCKSILVKGDYECAESVAIYSCPKGHGMWFKKKGINNPAKESQHVDEGGCPECGCDLVCVHPQAMPELCFYLCPSCGGFWLDTKDSQVANFLALKLELINSKNAKQAS